MIMLLLSYCQNFNVIILVVVCFFGLFWVVIYVFMGGDDFIVCVFYGVIFWMMVVDVLVIVDYVVCFGDDKVCDCIVKGLYNVIYFFGVMLFVFYQVDVSEILWIGFVVGGIIFGCYMVFVGNKNIIVILLEGWFDLEVD